MVVALGAAAWLVGARRVELAGRGTGGDISDLVDEVAEEVEGAEIRITTGEGKLTLSAAEIGLRVDRGATERAVRDEREDFDAVGWATSLVSPRSAPVVVTVDEAEVEDLVVERDPSGREAPVEPSLVEEDGELQVVAGRPGKGLSVTAVTEAVVDAARGGGELIEVSVEPGPLPPRFDREDAEALRARAEELTSQPLEVASGDAVAKVRETTLRRWITTVPATDGLRLALDPAEVADDLAELMPNVGEEPEDATVVIEGGRPFIDPGRDGTKCCAPEAAIQLMEALDRPRGRPVQVPLTSYPPRRTADDVEELGITELVGEFTTRFPAGQSRVKNIHRIAEIVRGTLIGPGGRFSVNDKVGERTTEKGFVAGGAIQDGLFTESIGGGISQFATTLFNAAFFAGLELKEYQSHSIYIDRYPYGREATLSWPKPDLVIGNDTPHGVLVWTSYTGTSVTVSLWSTRYATGEQTAQTEAPVGNCKRVRTQRTRTYVDGRTEVDHVFATYRPEEGVRC